jgi:transcriptional regulator with XRE-family HTH domain
MPTLKVEPAVLTDEECSVLSGWSRRRKTAQALALGSRIVLRCAEGGTLGEVAEDTGVSRNMVSKWRSRVSGSPVGGLDG